MRDNYWLSYYFYFFSSPISFLIERVIPFIEYVSVFYTVEKYFYIFYNDPFPHIRLRILPKQKDTKLEIEQFVIKDFYDKIINLPPTFSDINHSRLKAIPQPYDDTEYYFIFPTEYKPEIERYGGSYSIQIAEEQFYYSSKTIIEILRGSKEIKYSDQLGTAVQLHLGFISAFEFSLTNAINFYDYALKKWSLFNQDYRNAVEQGEIHEVALAKQKQKFQERLKSCDFIKCIYPSINEMWQSLQYSQTFDKEWMNFWIVSNNRIYEKFLSSHKNKHIIVHNSQYNHPAKNNPLAYLYDILLSILHMTNNRLGIMNHDEPYIAYLIYIALSQIEKNSDVIL